MPQEMTDLEKKVYRSLLDAHRRRTDLPPDALYLLDLTGAAIRALTVGSASGRRRIPKVSRITDPGCTPDKIRQLARRIEDSFTDMPSGWVSVAKRGNDG